MTHFSGLPADSPPARAAAEQFHVVLYQPEIPPNTGTIMRLCAVTATVLHLVGPLGFRLDTASLRRAGMDYRDLAQVVRWVDWNAYTTATATLAPRTLAITTKGDQNYAEWRYRPGDHLLFGSEGRGLPAAILADHQGRKIRIPMATGARSLNLAMSVGIVLYEALRQNDFPQLVP